MLRVWMLFLVALAGAASPPQPPNQEEAAARAWTAFLRGEDRTACAAARAWHRAGGGSWALYVLGRIHMRHGRLAEAEAAFREALEEAGSADRRLARRLREMLRRLKALSRPARQTQAAARRWAEGVGRAAAALRQAGWTRAATLLAREFGGGKWQRPPARSWENLWGGAVALRLPSRWERAERLLAEPCPRVQAVRVRFLVPPATEPESWAAGCLLGLEGRLYAVVLRERQAAWSRLVAGSGRRRWERLGRAPLPRRLAVGTWHELEVRAAAEGWEVVVNGQTAGRAAFPGEPATRVGLTAGEAGVLFASLEVEVP